VDAREGGEGDSLFSYKRPRATSRSRTVIGDAWENRNDSRHETVKILSLKGGEGRRNHFLHFWGGGYTRPGSGDNLTEVAPRNKP